MNKENAQEQMEYKKSEQFAIEEEERERKWQKQYGEKLSEVVEKMDRLLKEGTIESRRKLHDLFLDKSFFEHYKQTDIVAGMYVVMQIYEREMESGIAHSILEQGNTVEELLKYLEELKFILYRVDFDVDKESEQELIMFLKQHNTSVVTVEIMMTTVVMRPLQMALKLESLFEWNLMYTEQFMMQNFINQRWPGNYRILQKQAELYLKTGHGEYAGECLMKIPHYPTEICGKPQEILETQEKLWKIHYKERNGYIELVEEIKEKGMTEEAWKCFLQNEPSLEAEYYLMLADALLGAGLEQIAWVTLSYGEKIASGNEMILCLMADLCINRGDLLRAVECLKRVKEPGNMTRNFLAVCQEKMR